MSLNQLTFRGALFASISLLGTQSFGGSAVNSADFNKSNNAAPVKSGLISSEVQTSAAVGAARGESASVGGPGGGAAGGRQVTPIGNGVYIVNSKASSRGSQSRGTR